MLVALACAVMLVGCGQAPETEAVTQPPPAALDPAQNLVLICVDTVGAPNFFDPAIDDALSPWLAQALRYENAVSVAPWTIPAVASVLTGLYPVQHGAGRFPQTAANLDTDLPTGLHESARTLPEWLADAGFRTGAFSAHPWFAADFGLGQGFGQVHSRKGWRKVTSRFEEWLDSARAPGRFFGYLHFMEAHDWHLKPRPQLLARLAEVEPGVRQQLLEGSTDAACRQPDSAICLRNQVYNLAVREARAAIAGVLEGLRLRGRLDDTLVMVYSDHGEEFWQHKAQHERRGDPRGIYGFGHGQSLYQELLHVPLLAWRPGAGGATHDELVSLIDVLPSALAWLGLPSAPDGLPGQTLPLKPAARDRTRTVFASGIAYGTEAVSAREGNAKSIMYYPGESFEYFDLERDPEELRPVRDDGLVMRFDVLTGDYLDLRRDSLAVRPDLDEEQLEHLKSIGYLQGVEDPEPAGQPQEPSEPRPPPETPDGGGQKP